uniref:Uncharacterized protein n=1 Tax=Aegilops tauschii subsp. strangulata TaxID=200361 RepID=A0A452Z9J2_AEGTS
MLDPLPFCVLSESMPIPMLGGAEHPLFAGIKLFLSFLFSGDQAFPLQGPCAVNPLRTFPVESFVLAGFLLSGSE